MKLITINVPQAYLDGIEKLVDAEIYPNRSETIRIALRDFIKKEIHDFKFITS
ncbi:MAG: ribbon-helix-helix protein, CopG family [Candidatus Lokiarchaeota archaeon]|nr:ribbon-helix-helix protein, CopG family [Candidatus Lokiarchaeota archaeon]